MDVVQELFGGEGLRGFFSNAGNLSLALSPAVRSHLRLVYETLAALVGAAALGSFVHSSTALPGIEGGVLSLLAGFACFFAFHFTPATPANLQTRTYLIYAFALLQGMTLGPGIQHFSAVQPGTVTIALIATTLLFVSLSLSVLVSAQRNILLVASLISALITPLFWLSIVNMLAWSPAIDMIQLYMSLALFALFVVFDTQTIIAKAEAGSKDHLKHALDLFTDVVSLFVRILRILSRRRNERENRDKSSRRNR